MPTYAVSPRRELRRICASRASGYGTKISDLDNRPRKAQEASLRAMTDEEEQALRAKLAQLRQEHGDLDAAIAVVADSAHCDQLQLTRLKKRKLQLKDQ